MTTRRQATFLAVIARLETITTENGFNTSPRIERIRLPRNNYQILPLIVANWTNDSVGRGAQTSTFERRDLRIVLECLPSIEAPVQGQHVDLDVAIEPMAADVERLIAAERAKDVQWGIEGVEDTIVEDFSMITNDAESMFGFVASFVVRYRTDVDDPTQYRGA